MRKNLIKRRQNAITRYNMTEYPHDIYNTSGLYKLPLPVTTKCGFFTKDDANYRIT